MAGNGNLHLRLSRLKRGRQPSIRSSFRTTTATRKSTARNGLHLKLPIRIEFQFRTAWLTKDQHFIIYGRFPEEEWTTASQYAKLLSRESQHLMALGWGIDQVVGNGRVVTCEEASQLLGERWQPWPDTLHPLHRLRVPIEGSLEDLDAVYASFCSQLHGGVYNPPQTFRRFKSVHYVKVTQFPRRWYACFELPGGTAFRQESNNRGCGYASLADVSQTEQV